MNSLEAGVANRCVAEVKEVMDLGEEAARQILQEPVETSHPFQGLSLWTAPNRVRRVLEHVKDVHWRRSGAS